MSTITELPDTTPVVTTQPPTGGPDSLKTEADDNRRRRNKSGSHDCDYYCDWDYDDCCCDCLGD